MDLIIFSGKILMIWSSQVIAVTSGSSSFKLGGICTPTPALEILIAIKPKKSAMVVTTSKYNRDFQPILPNCLILECEAIPTTKVENNIGAIIVLIKRKNILLRKLSLSPISGK